MINGNTLIVTNLTGHKLITGYPEGRRMWLNIKWYDSNNQIIREDLERLTRKQSRNRALDQFKLLNGQGNSNGWTFNREELHERT